MALAKSKFIWMNGKFVRWDDAKIHILSHVIHYGSSVFEGIRCYKTPKGPAVFRLKEHMDRLFNSAKIYRMEIPYTKQKVTRVCLETIEKNEMNECYIRPVVYRGYRELGVNPFNCPVDVTVAVWKWGKYLGPGALTDGVDVMVSSWNRMAPNTFPAMAKAGGNYLNSQLVKMEALKYGFTEGIVLDIFGFVSEGSGENIFVVKDGALYTPPLGATILPGITRDAVIRIAERLKIKVIQDMFLREFLYIADEVFFTGSAAEITPIRSIDKNTIGKGKRGPITKTVQDSLLGIMTGKMRDRWGWLTYVK
ncbi:branched-chain amino acid transaminase [candidate division TA06 bacterium]|uniref:Branched-chain-amino-acid aminotransferase n=1 Tax=candidate division TA06 bacterium TaxID=2250710 RepID=A0A523XUN8_UNCT6|nr:MAG: branched-chain amino acid transaminase [candidate division TA06 bacterium]